MCLTGRRIVVTPPGPKTSKLLERDKQVISPSYYRTYPIVVDSGSDCLVRDVDGNVYIDLAASVAVLQTGHCHPKVVEAIKRQAERHIHYTFAGFCHEPGVELGEKFCQTTPGTFDKKVC
ncbi:MAG TPA: aminotransferase class III-fold pyridoxal phosphate-dependent enzyme, partial [Candidatus Bathyarchaeota archaeon]|nr:aminotransferase class III-fold pyridoxal phosphate-dependent enzyme [Candidatus Bathyarchaeota archaeon]